MQHLNDQFLFSPSDLGSFLACEHLTQLELAVALREGRRPSYENAYAELLRRKGQEHEQAFLATLHDAGRTVVEVRLSAWSYQVLDTKLARHPRPEHALQLSFYSQALEQTQHLAPDLAYVVLGTRERVAIRLADVTAYFRRVRQRFGTAVAARAATSPYPCHHCSF